MKTCSQRASVDREYLVKQTGHLHTNAGTSRCHPIRCEIYDRVSLLRTPEIPKQANSPLKYPIRACDAIVPLKMRSSILMEIPEAMRRTVRDRQSVSKTQILPYRSCRYNEAACLPQEYEADVARDSERHHSRKQEAREGW